MRDFETDNAISLALQLHVAQTRIAELEAQLASETARANSAEAATGHWLRQLRETEAQVAALAEALDDLRNTVAGFHLEPPTDADVMNACIDAELARRNLPAAAQRLLAAQAFAVEFHHWNEGRDGDEDDFPTEACFRAYLAWHQAKA